MVLGGLFVCFLIGHLFSMFYATGSALLLFFLAFIIADILMLYGLKGTVCGTRTMAQRFSNGDENEVVVSIQNKYSFPVSIGLVDEIPIQFQVRDFWMKLRLKNQEEKKLLYTLKPTERGVFEFGALIVYVSSPLSLLRRQIQFDVGATVKVYPSFLEMRKYELLAISNRLTEAGVHRIRKISNNSDFEQIREYVLGDDMRAINWKATARRSQMMVNQYQDEKSQQVYALIDAGRTMEAPFDGMSLLNYSINASLIMADVVLLKKDRAGLMSFSNKVSDFLPAESKKTQLSKVMESLHNLETKHEESDFEKVYVAVKQFIRKRSLLMVYTNFEGVSSMKRQLPYFKSLAKSHLVVIVFFKNTQLNKILAEKPNNLEDIYVKTITEKFEYEKRQIVKELARHGIHSVLTEPKELNVDVINKYLGLKAINLI